MKGFFSKEQTSSTMIRADGKVYSCVSCGRYQNCVSPKMEPEGQFKRKIMNIGHFPSKADDRTNHHFTGNGKEKEIEIAYKRIGVDLYRDCINLNAVNCYDEKAPDQHQLDSCRRIVLKAIKTYKPDIIVMFGNEALQTILKNHWKRSIDGVEKWRGYAIPDQEYKAWLIATYSPDYMISSRTKNLYVVDTLWDMDFDLIKSKLEKPIPIVEQPEIKFIRKLDRLDKIKDIIAFDYETTGLKPHAKGHRIVSCSIATSENEVIAFLMPEEADKQLPFINLLKHPRIKKMAHNMKFEDNWTEVQLKTSIANWYWDSMLAAHIIDNRMGVTGLKFQSYVHFGIADFDSRVHPYLESSGKSANSMNRIEELLQKPSDIEELLTYNAWDSILEFRLAKLQQKLILGK